MLRWCKALLDNPSGEVHTSVIDRVRALQLLPWGGSER